MITYCYYEAEYLSESNNIYINKKLSRACHLRKIMVHYTARQNFKREKIFSKKLILFELTVITIVKVIILYDVQYL